MKSAIEYGAEPAWFEGASSLAPKVFFLCTLQFFVVNASFFFGEPCWR